MKKFILPLIAVLFISVTACKSSKKPERETNEPKTLADSLMKDIDEGHMFGMSKIGKLHNLKNDAQRILDSIGKLPAKAQQAVMPYLDQLKSGIKDLEYADFAMDKWMTEFEMDSAINDVKQRVQYLTEEKLKVDKVKEAIVTSMQKADSLLKAKL